MANAFSSRAVALCPVTKDNFETVAELELHPHQRAFLASNRIRSRRPAFIRTTTRVPSASIVTSLVS